MAGGTASLSQADIVPMIRQWRDPIGGFHYEFAFGVKAVEKASGRTAWLKNEVLTL